MKLPLFFDLLIFDPEDLNREQLRSNLFYGNGSGLIQYNIWKAQRGINSGEGEKEGRSMLRLPTVDPLPKRHSIRSRITRVGCRGARRLRIARGNADQV